MTANEAVAKYGSIRKAAKALGVAYSTMQKRVRAGDSAAPAAKPDAPASAKGKTLADFRAQYDKSFIVPQRVREGLRKLGASGWEYEVEFAKIAGVSLADLGRFRDQFADYVIQIGRDSRRAWAGSKAMAQAMREALS